MERDLMAKFKLVEGWSRKDLRCHFCHSTKSVKYEMNLFDPVIDDSEPSVVYVCNLCALKYSRKKEKE